jgi:3-deoxy-7-phosphoheptulonate synthase
MASGLSMPIGYKKRTDGGLQIALDAMISARNPHSFLGIDQDGVTSIIRTTGNPVGHVVLRGGRSRPNYDSTSLREAEQQLARAGFAPGADGGLQPRQFWKTTRPARGSLAERH